MTLKDNLSKNSIKHEKGFTIVELLITIVIISILATITIISFVGIQAKANNATVISYVNQWEKTLRLYKASNGNFPKGNLDYVCLGDEFIANETFTENQCAKMSTWGVVVDNSMMESIKNTLSINIPRPKLPTYKFINLSNETEYYRGALYLSRNNGFGITYMIQGNDSCAVGDSFFESHGTVACRRVLEGEPYEGL